MKTTFALLVSLLLTACAILACADGSSDLSETQTAAEQAAAFSDWFIVQDFQGNDYYTWKAVLDALTDGIDRSREPNEEIINPVYVAIRTGTKYHTEDCGRLENASLVLELDQAEAEERGFEACERCK